MPSVKERIAHFESLSGAAPSAADPLAAGGLSDDLTSAPKLTAAPKQTAAPEGPLEATAEVPALASAGKQGIAPGDDAMSSVPASLVAAPPAVSKSGLPVEARVFSPSPETIGSDEMFYIAQQCTTYGGAFLGMDPTLQPHLQTAGAHLITLSAQFSTLGAKLLALELDYAAAYTNTPADLEIKHTSFISQRLQLVGQIQALSSQLSAFGATTPLQSIGGVLGVRCSSRIAELATLYTRYAVQQQELRR